MAVLPMKRLRACMIVTAIPSAKLAWVRYCAGQPEVSVSHYATGYALLSDRDYASQWLQRGFESMLKAIRNSEVTL